MIKELDPTSDVGNLMDYLIEHGVNVHILVPDGNEQSFEIVAVYTIASGRRAKCTKRIDLNQYRCLPSELRNMIMTRTIHAMVEELVYLQ